MTLEELKAEAKKHGYKLTKEYIPIRFAQCICGQKGYAVKHIKLNPHQYYYKCNRCGFSADGARTQREAKLKWNEYVENARKEQ
jgi:hypothetical protein